MVPNLVTLIGLCGGLASMRFGLRGQFGYGCGALVFAACMDGLDGRLARLLKGTSRFGAEFDSLSDFMCFGIAPSFLLTLWSLPATMHFSLVPCMMFSVCMALRLARFNAALDDDEQPKYAAHFFQGVPAPAGAGLALFPIFVGLEAQANHMAGLLRFAKSPYLAVFCLMATAALLVSTLPVWSFKNFRLPAKAVLPMMVGTGLYIALLVTEPWGALAAAGVIYMAMLPFSRASYWRLRRAAESAHSVPNPDPLADKAP
ncbi:phosphatidylcholine/phosphatidylserine synthase [Formicincola oecophyllae]|uniref:Phosphatidylcholine/phosphatidylserine synthase n=2 Tax=Formicincola oecophyllae TaxID=2558361 RepID=A0A4Y6U9X0_9PROT|nr:phosphatidylcholine/phosphatidylserine synthase [Formicincola oecophyllae]QDH14279.1 phosphatidylcholine/phosphatidylserine synthase [Formicincola oecophyllae]